MWGSAPYPSFPLGVVGGQGVSSTPNLCFAPEGCKFQPVGGGGGAPPSRILQGDGRAKVTTPYASHTCTCCLRTHGFDVMWVANAILIHV
jgi:hypothetical protein